MLRRLTVIVVCTLVLVGCATKGGRIGAGTGLAAFGGLLLASSDGGCESGDIGCAGVSEMSQGLGLAFLVTGGIVLLMGIATEDEPPAWVYPVYAPMPYVLYPVPPPPAPLPAVTITIPAHATRALAIRTSEASRRGDCATAVAAGDELERVDADVHHALIAIDHDYARCVRGF